MKRIIVLFIVFCIAGSLFALEEVRGIQTRLSKYDCDSCCYGFELTNENQYSVWVETELYYKNDRNDRVSDTKNITLKPGETYLWKNDLGCSSYYKYYIKYKAYKKQ